MEDAAERYGQWLQPFDVVRSYGDSGTASTAAPVTLHPCPSCTRIFSSGGGLSDHLFESHRSDRFHLRVNDRPAYEFTVLSEALRSVMVVSTGDKAVKVTVAIDGKLVGRFDAVPGLETEVLPAPVDRGLLTVDLAAGDRKRSYEVYVQTAPQMDPGPLDAAVRLAQEPLERGDASLQPALLDDAQGRHLGSLERRYLEGFCEYLMAADLDRGGNHAEAGWALERAWGQLLIFGTELARSTISVLAFRFDLLGFLANPATGSSLAGVARYLMSPPQISHLETFVRTGHGIWIDDFQEALIASARDAAGQRFEAALRSLDDAPASLSAAAGNERKSTILRARISDAVGDLEAARIAYSALRSDPMYATEAEAWLR